MVFPRADCWRGALMTVIPGRRGVPDITWIGYKQTVQLFLILQRTADMSKVTYIEIKSCPRIQNKAMKIKYSSQGATRKLFKKSNYFFSLFQPLFFCSYPFNPFFLYIASFSSSSSCSLSPQNDSQFMVKKNKCKWHILRHSISE